MPEIVIFDLDGTLLDTSSGIYNSVRYVERQMGLKPVREDELRLFVGPPPRKIYKEIYQLDDDKALLAARKHREYGTENAIYEADVYEGIPEVLENLKNRGYKLGVATLKKQNIAERILKIFNLDHFFDSIVGMDEDETYTKEITINKVMEQTNSKTAVLVGDSLYDLEGAQSAKVDFIGVLYGFGFNKKEEYKFKSVENPFKLLNFLRGKN